MIKTMKEIFNNNYKVLVVDDVINNYTYLMNVLKKLHCEVIYAGNGKEAIQKCKTLKDIDLVFMDLYLPIIDGFKATEIIRSFRKDLPIIAVTAFSSGENRKKAKESGCNDYIVKPIFMFQIENIISKYRSSINNYEKNKKSIGVSRYL